MRAKPITIHAAKTNLSRLIERVERGEEIVIARGKAPVAKLVPLTHGQGGRKFGAMKGKAGTTPAFFAPLHDDELDAWER